MPEILIRGMEMPRNCFECPLFTNCDACEGHECGCGLLGGIGYEEDISEDRRRDDCPIVEVPPHGDLIDRDAVVEEQKLSRDYHAQNGREEALLERAIRIVREAPVVVPAERSWEE